MTAIEQVISETRSRRDEACALLDALVEAKSLNAQVREETGPDIFEDVTGRSSMDSAIDQAKRLVDSFDRILSELSVDAEVASRSGASA